MVRCILDGLGLFAVPSSALWEGKMLLLLCDGNDILGEFRGGGGRERPKEIDN